MIHDHMFHAQLLARISSQKEADRELHQVCAGRTVKIIGDYNGQPYGHSRPSLKGKTFQVQSASFNGDSIDLFLEGQRVGIDLKDVQFLRDSE